MNLRCCFLIPLFLIFPFFFTGCSSQEERSIDKIVVLSGADQSAMLGKDFPNPLTIRVMGPKRPGLLGGAGEAEPATQVKVSLSLADGSDLKVLNDSVLTTSHDGIVRFSLAAGGKIGDQYINITAQNTRGESASVKVRLIAGILLNWEVQEGHGGTKLDDPLTVTIQDVNQKPLQGVPVYFKAIDGGKGQSEISVLNAVTDADGKASCSVVLGNKTGPYRIGFEIHDPKHNLQVMTKTVYGMGINTLGLLISVAGGLALFILGMKTMSDGLHLVAGDKMKKVLGFLTQNRFMGILAGTLVTAIMQSSSATTVMVVGFVNAGLLNLVQSISVIFGANIGTTMTAQIISFNLDILAQPAIILGLIILLIVRKTYYQGWANTILGFGLLFFGMSIMSAELKSVGSFPSFIDFFKTFECEPVNGSMPILHVLGAIGIGTIMTMFIQSSSATIGIAIALATSGLLSFWTAVPLILGDNIGTTITALLASLGGNRRSKQTAMAHVMFNVLGATWMFILFFISWPGTDKPVALYFVNLLTPGDGFIGENIGRHVANAHTIFNVVNVLMLLPFMGYIAWIVTKILPIRGNEKEKFNYLDPHLLETPPVALEQVVRSIRYMVKESAGMIGMAIEHCFIPGVYDEELAHRLDERESKIDRIQHEVTRYLVHLTQRRLTDTQCKIVPLLVHCTNNAERIGDQADVIMKLSRRLADAHVTITPATVQELEEILVLLKRQFHTVIGILDQVDGADVYVLMKEEGQMDTLTEKFESLHLARLSNREDNATASVIVIELIAELERISARLVNIGERIGKVNKLTITLKA